MTNWTDDPHIVVPEWMTSAQVATISTLYNRDANGAVNRAHFFHRVVPIIGGGGAVGVKVGKCFYRIEPDGALYP
jgi:hypothetical protein